MNSSEAIRKVVEAVAKALTDAGIEVDEVPLVSRKRPQWVDRFSFRINGKRYALVVWALSDRGGSDG